MDPRLLRHYNTELLHLREMGAEFAQQFPRIAARLGMASPEVADPYVERLLEGSAFLAARVQLKLEEEFPRFTQRLAAAVLPQTVCPTPAMLIARLAPDFDNPNLIAGFTVPRQTALMMPPGQLGMSETSACEFRTGADLTLWPVALTEASYLPRVTDLPLAALPAARAVLPRVKGALRLRLATPPGIAFSALPLDTLSLYFSGGDEIAYALHECVTGHALAVVVAAAGKPGAPLHLLDAASITRPGFSDGEALLPVTPNAFQGYRLLHEYFAFPQRFRFARIGGLAAVLPALDCREIDVTILLSSSDAALERVVSASHVLLDCVPAVNLFPKRADRAFVTENTPRFHVVPDRMHPLDFEVHSVSRVTGFGSGAASEQVFHPFYADYLSDRPGSAAYFTIEREPRRVPDSRKHRGYRTDYVGSEVFVSIVDTAEAPYRGDLRQLAFETLCTNRDLPLLINAGGAAGPFTLEIAAPVAAATCVAGPSRPGALSLDGAHGWRLIDQFSLHYLSLSDNGGHDASSDAAAGAAALRALLSLHVTAGDEVSRNQIAGVLSVAATPVVRRLPMRGPIAFGRGLSITVTADDLAFQGASAYLLGCVLDSFFARYVSINTFVQTVLRTPSRGEILRLSPRCGTRPIF